jgi:membrane protease YdiL (CAAX protease family)
MAYNRAVFNRHSLHRVNDSNPGAAVEASGPHWGLWGTLVWGLVIAFAFVAMQWLTVSAAAASRAASLSEAQLKDLHASAASNGYFLSLATFVTTIVCCGLVAIAIRFKPGARLRDYLGLRSVTPGTLAKWSGFLVALLICWDLVSLALGRPIVPDFVREVYETAQPLWLLWLAIVIAGPLFEEVFFRGFLLAGFASSFMGPRGAIVLTAALWAVIHWQYDAYHMAFIFLLGLVFGAARIRTGSLLVPLILHALTNLGATIEAALLG